MMLKIRKRGGVQEAYSVEDFLNFRYAECDKGWDRLIIEMFQELLAAGWDGSIAQVKEKFGLLRVYLEVQSLVTYLEEQEKTYDELYEIVYKYEKLSESICEVCGAAGAKLRTLQDGRPWIKTNCDICHDIFIQTSKMLLDKQTKN